MIILEKSEFTQLRNEMEVLTWRLYASVNILGLFTLRQSWLAIVFGLNTFRQSLRTKMHANVLGLNTLRQQLLSYTCSLSSVCITCWVSTDNVYILQKWKCTVRKTLFHLFVDFFFSRHINSLEHNTSNLPIFWATRKGYFPHVFFHLISFN